MPSLVSTRKQHHDLDRMIEGAMVECQLLVLYKIERAVKESNDRRASTTDGVAECDHVSLALEKIDGMLRQLEKSYTHSSVSVHLR
jgi:hypothetical protein